MQLKYRGIAYQPSVSATEATTTTETGLFLGARFSRKQYVVPQRQQPQSELTFMGRRYSR